MQEEYTPEDVIALGKELRQELEKARVDYINKKELKGEPIDKNKMRMALNGRKIALKMPLIQRNVKYVGKMMDVKLQTD